MLIQGTQAQLKFVIEDFDGIADDKTLLSNGFFSYGSCSITICNEKETKNFNNGNYVSVVRTNKEKYGGFGKGVGRCIQLDVTTDHINFYIHSPAGRISYDLILQEDDDGNGSFTKEKDDTWRVHREMTFGEDESCKLETIPLLTLKDDNPGGDGIFNCSYREGKLLSIIIDLPQPGLTDQTLGFDFFSFSKGSFPISAESGPGCSLGLWSKEDDEASLLSIAYTFDKISNGKKKAAVIHFFQPFSLQAGDGREYYPSVKKMSDVIESGYIPMVTLENHFPGLSDSKQPNLYNILEGHFDDFFVKWAQHIKAVKSIVLIRLLHEFNGNWYPWSIAANDKNPELVAKAFRHIHAIFKAQEVENARFIWCPNSMSVPQESWNSILDAYPGDEYVDLVGTDIYNGAGKGSELWRSFLKEGMENYFLFTENFPNKPIVICETASRERTMTEPKISQGKGEWIKEMSRVLKTTMNKVVLLTWFNEKKKFLVRSSKASSKTFTDHVIDDPYFLSGPLDLWKKLQK